jgi:hypothetical protein
VLWLCGAPVALLVGLPPGPAAPVVPDPGPPAVGCDPDPLVPGSGFPVLVVDVGPGTGWACVTGVTPLTVVGICMVGGTGGADGRVGANVTGCEGLGGGGLEGCE